MGKGDRKTRRGKLFGGSYGVLRPRRRKRAFSVVNTTKKPIGEAEEPQEAPKSKSAPSPKAEEIKAETVDTKVEPVESKAEPEERVVKPTEAGTAAKKTADKKPDSKKETTAKKDPGTKKADTAETNKAKTASTDEGASQEEPTKK